ncbi:MAG TPA: tripartite tricarboxylate transporter substrate binding protein, partial [Ramlibacter sp.]|nr:tripartite tricarboxylate transporter substrate binding protein [Ramlibacter sp.]
MQRRHFTAALAATVAAPLVRAQNWPTRPIKVLVGYPPGGFTDVTARLICDKLGRRLGQPVIVDN